MSPNAGSVAFAIVLGPQTAHNPRLDRSSVGATIQAVEATAGAVVAPTLIFIGVPLLVALGELLLIVVLALAGVVGRVLFRRPWTVDAVDPAGTQHAWSVVGWKASGAARQLISDRIAATGAVPTDDEVSAALLAS